MAEDPDVEKAVEAFDGSGRRIGITLWKDGHVSVCEVSEPKKYECYVTSKPEGERLYYLAQAYYASLGFRIKRLEGSESSE